MSTEDCEERVKAAAQARAAYLTQAELAEIIDLADHAEPGVAYEMLCNQLYEHGWPPSPRDLLELTELGGLMGLKPSALNLWEHDFEH